MRETRIAFEMKSTPAPFKARLRATRQPKTQAQAALAIGMSVRTLQNWECGRNIPAAAVQADAIARLNASDQPTASH